MTDFHVIIPARFNSQRLPGKVLKEIAGKPMIQHVYERALESGAISVVIATDDKKVAKACEKFKAPVCMTESSHASGTDRLAEAVVALEYDSEEIVVCLQGDEPQMPPQLISQVAHNLAEHDNAKVATIAEKITNPEDLFNSHIVKVVMNYRNFAIYFSRAPIPWQRDSFKEIPPKNINTIILTENYFRHIGLYAYHVSFLEEYTSFGVSPLEKLESLEQLRVLWNGYKIHVGVTECHVPAGVDLEVDLERVRRQLKN